MTGGVWRARGGWSSNADVDLDHPVWLAWGGSGRSTSGWVSDPAATMVRFQEPDGRVAIGTVEKRVAILVHDTGFDRETVVEVLDADGNVLHAAPLQSE